MNPVSSPPSIEDIPLDGGRLRYWAEFLSDHEQAALFTRLQTSIDWQQEYLTIYGRRIPMPRLTAWYGDKGAHYRYSGVSHHPAPWPAELARLRRRLQEQTGLQFNAVLVNLYRNEQDGVSWHADNEAELQPAPQIASISLGAARPFQLTRKRGNRERRELLLEPGSLLLMLDDTQANWRHRLPKLKTPTGPRINLTFRLVRTAVAD